MNVTPSEAQTEYLQGLMHVGHGICKQSSLSWHDPCGFITFFDVIVITHVTVCDVHVIRKTNCTTMLDSSHKSALIAKQIIPVGS